MLLSKLWLTDFRSYGELEVGFADGLTAVLGPNGHGKTNLLEAIGYLATLDSFRGAPTEALIRDGAQQAVIRAEGSRDGRDLLLEAEIVAGGRNRIFLNRQKLPRARDLLGALRVTVFSPDDLALVKGGPGGRRRYLDDVLISLHPRYDALQGDVERILRQRNALLKQCASARRLDESASSTLDVWDAKLAEAGTLLGEARRDLVARLEPALARAYAAVASSPAGTEPVALRYDAPWMAHGLATALADVRLDELRRGVTLAGPHRDDLVVHLDGLPARTHASQGEQRALALAMRLGGHSVVTAATGTPPVLLLDDVFSELDPVRSDALLDNLPAGQAILTSAAGLPPRARPDEVVRIEASVMTHPAIAP
ncbi:MAG: DNA replication/repair protein RecF [Acidimicrobiales bacterium]